MTTYETTMSAPYLDGPVSFDSGLTTAELMTSQPAISYPSPVPYPQPHDMSYHSPTIGHQSRSPYASSYEDGFPDLQLSSRSSPEVPSIERGNKLLAFQPSTSQHAVLDYSMRHSNLNIQAQLHGMFFLAESSRTLTSDLASSPAELTCYRRNLFQITGNVTLPRMMQYVVNEAGERMPIVSQELTISATESVEGSPVKIISVPWKTPATGTAPPPEEAKVEKEPTSIPLDQTQNHDADAEFSVFPIAWKRLQFRVATANNGRRRELQQHFTIKLSVTATLSDGSKLSLCDALSGPIIVRGRSPRNFQARKDIPLSGSGVSMRKSMSVSPSMRRSSTLDSIHRATPKLDEHHYGLSPSDALRRGSPTPAGGFDWPHPVTSAPVSPYHGSLPDLSRGGSVGPSSAPSSVPGSNGSGLKRKADDAGLGMYDVSGRSSAPPDERPRKMVRPRGATIGSTPPPTSMPLPHLPPTSHHTGPYSYPPSGLPPPGAYYTGAPGAFAKDDQAGNQQLLQEYGFGVGDGWQESYTGHPQEGVYRMPQVASGW